MVIQIGDVYGITGAFENMIDPNLKEFFGGYFSVEKKNTHGFGSVVSGCLTDGNGASKIKGNFGFDFTEVYDVGIKRVGYHLRKTIGGVWVGNNEIYGISKGKVEANINLFMRGSDTLERKSFNPEQSVETIVNGLLSCGKLESSLDEN